MNINEIRPDGIDFLISLKKLLGQNIVDVYGYISDIGAGPSFKLTDIVLGDGQQINVEGEHDFPYLTEYSIEAPLGVDPDCELMRELDRQQK